MKIELLVSTMNQSDLSLVEKMNIRTNVLFINQTENMLNLESTIGNSKIRMLSFNERGLSKSRNRAMENSIGDICLFCDDDMFYYDQIDQKLKEIAIKHPDVSVFVFNVDNHKSETNKVKKRLGFRGILKVSSVQIAFRREDIIKNGIRFLEDFGTGSLGFSSGEENIFLKDCLNKGLVIYSIPISIGRLVDSNSTWFKGYNEKYFYDKGALFYELSSQFWVLMNIIFAIKKIKLYKNQISFLTALKSMYKGGLYYRKRKLNKNNVN